MHINEPINELTRPALSEALKRILFCPNCESLNVRLVMLCVSYRDEHGVHSRAHTSITCEECEYVGDPKARNLQ